MHPARDIGVALFDAQGQWPIRILSVQSEAWEHAVADVLHQYLGYNLAFYTPSVLLLMAFGSLRNALLIMVNLPLALIGGVLAVFLGGGVISVASLVGFVTLRA